MDNKAENDVEAGLYRGYIGCIVHTQAPKYGNPFGPLKQLGKKIDQNPTPRAQVSR